MSGPRRAERATVLPLAVALIAGPGCSSGRASCAELEAELAEMGPTTAQAWEDITVLQESIPRALELEAEIAERCG